MPNLIICGCKGAGKTTFGKQLAGFLQLQFIDTDALIEKQTGKSVRQLFLLDAGETFRQIEKQVVASLQNLSNHVIALGGGTLCDQDSRAIILQLGQLIYLQVDKQILKEQADRVPNLDFDLTYAERVALFESLPTIKIPGYRYGQ